MAPLSGGGIDTLRRVGRPINAPCAGRARVDASRDKELPEHAKDVGTQDVALCEVQILTRSNRPAESLTKPAAYPERGIYGPLARWSGGPLIRAWSWFDSKMVHQN